MIESRNSIYLLDGINQEQYPTKVDNQSFFEQPTRFCIYQLRQRGSNTHEGNVCVVFRKRNMCKHMLAEQNHDQDHNQKGRDVDI